VRKIESRQIVERRRRITSGSRGLARQEFLEKERQFV
jgi:hypothetical protein